MQNQKKWVSMINKIIKICLVLLRKLIFLFDGVDNKLFTLLYYQYLKKRGVKFGGRPNYISSLAYIDGQGMDIISIGKDVVISRDAMLLTHDYSVETALHAIGKGTADRHLHINEKIIIGDNSFIGARSSLLPGTIIGKNCIIGACSVIKGVIPDGSVVVGNPGKIVSNIYEQASKFEGDQICVKKRL